MSDELTIDLSEDRAGVTVARVSGRLDAKSAPRVMGICTTVAEEGRDLVLVLEQVTFLSSAGVGVLLAVTELFRERDRFVRLASLSPVVEGTVRLLNLESFLMIDASESAALGALGA